MLSLSDSRVELAPAKTTGTGRKYGLGFRRWPMIAIEFVVEAVGGTPTVTFEFQVLPPGGDPAVAGDWVTTGYVVADSTVAAAKTAITKTAVGKTVVFLDGLDKRFADGIAVNVTANTNVTYHINAYPGA